MVICGSWWVLVLVWAGEGGKEGVSVAACVFSFAEEGGHPHPRAEQVLPSSPTFLEE